ncbi:hypothetical protein Ae201684P_007180 [Aphanomyces euteiches]|uniref:Uncharacterized protein n=1 Tax=Aphanomyces euteiches TaxID=100861 RepID=A0A6G0WB33_9STRA|nr:hypothetical protein Ae201684_017668 [Aphanomyces euteiches]KAH9100991.1 hypothetical protein Ae201684P_007180 [Aphanomyces euteiches]KAH9143831.1 hypothetical protein AeRB84_012190 [Aphanomyces euteiches]
MINIAFAIPDAKDLFGFLEALYPYGILGPLEHLYRLSLTQKHSDLWPSLRLDASTPKERNVASYAAIARYYPKVVVQDIMDVQWLKTLNVRQMEWITEELWQGGDEWITLPITHFTWQSYIDVPNSWSSCLPQLNCLKALKVYTRHQEIFHDVCALAAKSDTLIHLEVNYGFEPITETALRNLIEWFRRQPVQVFGYTGVGWKGLNDVALKQELFKAMFNCPTLDKLMLHRCYLLDMDVSRNLQEYTFSMKTLELHDCSVKGSFLEKMISRLKNSKALHLSLHGYHLMDMRDQGIQHLLRSLPRMPIKHLALSDDRIGSPVLNNLVPFLEHCPVETLMFRAVGFTKAVVAKFVKAIQNNQTIYELDLGRSWLTIDELRLVIESFTHPSRLVKTKRIKVHPSKHWVESGSWDDFKKLTTERVGEFVEVQVVEDYS